jgi:hypothetical protein
MGQFSRSATDIHTSFRAKMDKDRELLDPRVIAAAGALGMTVTQAKETTAGMNLSLLAMLGTEEAPVGQIVPKYVLGGPLINPEEEDGISTHMRNLLGWYKVHIQNKDFKQYFTAGVRKKHQFKRYLIHIQLHELFQLFNQRDLDKSIITCYCL